MPPAPWMLERLIALEAQEQGVSPRLALAVAHQESGLNPQAVGDNGQSLGLFQLQRAAAIDAGIDPNRRQEVALNITGGVRYLKQKLQQSGGNVEQALSRYNRGTPTYQGIGDPRYVQHVLAKMEGNAPRQGLLQRVGRALSPAGAEAAPVSPAQSPPEQAALRRRLEMIERLEAIQRQEAAAPAAPPSATAPAPSPAPPAPAPPPAQPPPTPPVPAAVSPASAAPLPASPRAATPAPVAQQTDVAQWLPGFEFLHVLPRQTQEQVVAQTPEVLRGAAATGISTTGAMLGTAVGSLAAPFTGPLAPAMPLVGEMAGSYLARQANVALGLEKPDMLGDVLSVAGPAVTGGRQVVQGFRTGAPQAPQRAAPLLRHAERTGVPLTYGEAVGSAPAKRAETLLEQVPVAGTGGFRTRQQAAVKAAGQAQLDAQQAALRETPWHGLPQVQAAAQQGSKQAQKVLDQVAQAGDDWSKIVQASGTMKAFRARQVASTLYNKVGELAEGLGNVPLTKTVATIDDTLKQLRTAVVPDTETIRYLEQLKSGLQGQTSTTVSPLLDAAGNPITRTVTTPGKTTYGQLRQLRSDLGDTISDYYKGSNAVVGAKGVGSLAKVKTALEQDLDTFALQSPNPELAAAAKQADTFYKRQVVPYEDRQLAAALTSDTPDEIYGKFIQRGHRDRAQKFYNALDPKGQAAVRYGMIAEAQQQALNTTTGVFSPAKFDSSVQAIEDATGVFFRGQAGWELDGLKKVMRAAERAGYFAENPPTGNRLVPLLLGGGAVAAGLGPAAAAATTATGLSWLLTSRAGSRLLLKAHGMAEQSLGWEQLLRELTTQAGRIVATEAGAGLQEGTQVPVQPGRVGR